MGGGVAWGHSQTHYFILTCERYYGWRGCLGTFTDTLLYPHMLAVLWVAVLPGDIHRHTTISSHVSGTMCGEVGGDIHRHTTISSHVSGTMCGGVAGDIHRHTTISSHVSGTMDGGVAWVHSRHTTISSHVSGTMGGGVAWGHSQTQYYILTCERYYGWRGCLWTRYFKLLVIACNILCNRYMVYNSSEQVDSTMTPNICITKYILLMRVYAIHVVQFIY